MKNIETLAVLLSATNSTEAECKDLIIEVGCSPCPLSDRQYREKATRTEWVSQLKVAHAVEAHTVGAHTVGAHACGSSRTYRLVTPCGVKQRVARGNFLKVKQQLI